jgi:PAS domain S-box-containing protein
MAERILLVDDEDGIRRVLSISLADLGYEVYTAPNGPEALAGFRELDPSIVLTDIKMPGMDGVTLLKRLKGENPEVEVIMITGHGDMDLAIQSLKHDAADFITKPIDDELLEIALRRVSEKITMRRELRNYTEHLEDMVREKSARLVELEREMAVGQVVEGMTSTLSGLTRAFHDGQTSYFNEMPCYVAVYDRSRTVVAANPLHRKRFGHSVGRTTADLYAGTGEECPVITTFQTGTGGRVTTSLLTTRGARIPVIVHTAPIKGNSGEVEMVLEIAVDVTEVKRLKDELRTTRERFQQLFNEVPCYISVQDMDLRIAATNNLFKRDIGDYVGAYCYDVYHHRSRPCEHCPVFKTFEDGRSYQSEAVITARDGRQYNVLVWTAPIRGADGEVTQVMEMSTDITQIRNLQDHLTSLGLLLGSASHGIKGMLTALDGGLYRLESGLRRNDPDRTEEALGVVKHMVGRVQSMVLDVLYYAKSRDLSRQEIEVQVLAAGLAETVEPRAAQYGVTFERDFRPDLGTFTVDDTALSSALTNFLENGIDACTMPGGPGGNKKVVFGVHRHDDHIEFSIRDNGIGMDRETREKIFTLFFSSKGNRGTGLGLFIANQVVEQHGGDILVESSPGHGSRFTVRIPFDGVRRAAGSPLSCCGPCGRSRQSQ